MEFTGISGSKYNIIAGIKFNTSRAGIELKNALKDFEKISTVQVNAVFNGEEAIKQVTTYKDAVGNLFKEVQNFKKLTTDGGKSFQLFALDGGEVSRVKQIAESFGELKKVTEVTRDATGKLTKTINEYKDGVLQCVNVTKQWTEADGSLVTQIDKLDANGNKLADTIKNITKDTTNAQQQFGVLTTSTETTVSATGRLITRVKEYKDGVLQCVNVTQKWTDADGQLITQTQKLDADGKKLADTIKNIVKDTTKVEQQFGIIHKTTETTRSATGRLVTRVKEYKDGVLQAVNVTQQWTNAQGQLETQIQKLDANGKKLADTIRTTTTPLKEEQQTFGVISTTTETTISATGRLVTRVKEYKDGVLQAVTVTQQWTNAQGQLETQVQKLDANGKKLADTVRTTTTALQQQQQTFGVMKTSTETSVSANGRLITRVKEYKDGVLQAVNVTQQWINADGQLETQIQKLDANGNKLDNTIRRTTNDIGAINSFTQTLRSQMGTTSNVLQNLIQQQNSFIATMGKIVKFQIITKIITGFTTACRNAIAVVKEFDSQLTEFKKVSELSGDALDDYTRKLGELGVAVARTRTQMVEGATQFRKAGFDDETSAKLAQISALFQNIADSELSAGESSTFIISQMKAFRTELAKLGDEGKQATYVIDSINEVSNNMAVSSTDISTALSKTASAMSALGNNYNETIALVTSGTEIMQGQASKVARGLRSFGNQIAKVATDAGELSFEVQGVTKSITLMGQDGNLKSTYQVLREISAEWDNMTSAERQTLAISLANKTQFEVFTSVLNNFEDAEKALTLAEKAQGSAWRENARYMESIEARFQALKTAVQNLILGDGGVEKLIKNILKLATNFVELIDKAGGLTVVISALAGVLILLNNKAIVNLLLSIPKLIVGIGEYIVAVVTATDATEVFIAVASVASFGIGALLVAITGVAMAFAYFYSEVDRSIDKIQELNGKIENENKEIEEITKQIEEYSSKLIELNKLKEESPDLVEQKEIDNLNFTIRQLERELAIKKEIAKEDEKKRNKEAEDVVFGKIRKPTNGQYNRDLAIALGNGVKYNDKGSLVDANFELSGAYDVTGKDNYQVLKVYTDRITKINEETQALQVLQSKYKEGSVEYSNYQKQIEKNTEVEEKQRSLAQELAQNLSSAIEGISETSMAYKLGKDALDYYSDGLLNVRTAEEQQQDALFLIDSVISDTVEQYNLTAEQEEELADSIDEATSEIDDEEEAYKVAIKTKDDYIAQLQKEQDETQDTKKMMEDWNASMDAFQESYKTLASAVEEYNSAEGITIDTLQSLLALDPEYLGMLDMENGKLVLNKQALMDKATAQINEARAMVYAEAVEKLKILADKNQKESAENASNSLDTQTDALNRNTQALIENNEKEVLNWTIKAKQNGASLSEIQQVISDMRTQLSLLNNVANSVSVNFDNAMKTGRDTSDKARDSLNKTNKAVDATKQKLEELKQKVQDLKDEVDEYEKVIDYFNDKIDEQIDTLEEQRDTEVKAIEDRIDAIEKLEEAEEDRIKEEIKLLEEERDTLIDNAKLEISALQEKQNAEEEYWNKKIQALKDQNQELQDQADLQKLLDNLEKARNTKIRVYKKGKGFVWETDQNAVSKAEKELEDYNRKKDYEKQLAELEKFKKEALDNYEKQINDLKTYNDKVKNEYDKQIENLNKLLEEKKKKFKEEKATLEEQKKAVEDNYNAQIKVLENYKKEFEKQVKSYEQEQLRLLALQKTGIDTEQENWTTRLSNLTSFITEYHNKLKELEKAQKELNEFEKNNKTTDTGTTGGIDTGGSGGNNGGGTTDNGNPDPNKNTKQVKRTRTVWYANGKKFGTQAEAQAEVNRAKNDLNNQINSIRNAYGMPQSAKDSQIATLQGRINSLGITQGSEEYYETITYAKGVASIGSNQFAIVGENPNKELVIGSKLNGLGLNLSKGTGVVNAKSTGTLAGLFNMLGGELGNVNTGNYSTNNLSNQSVNNYHIDNISLPQVKDVNDFINALSNFDNIMAQKAYSF